MFKWSKIHSKHSLLNNFSIFMRRQNKNCVSFVLFSLYNRLFDSNWHFSCLVCAVSLIGAINHVFAWFSVQYSLNRWHTGDETFNIVDDVRNLEHKWTCLRLYWNKTASTVWRRMRRRKVLFFLIRWFEKSLLHPFFRIMDFLDLFW